MELHLTHSPQSITLRLHNNNGDRMVLRHWRTTNRSGRQWAERWTDDLVRHTGLPLVVTNTTRGSDERADRTEAQAGRRATMVRLREEGEPQREIAARLDLTPAWVCRILQQERLWPYCDARGYLWERMSPRLRVALLEYCGANWTREELMSTPGVELERLPNAGRGTVLELERLIRGEMDDDNP